MQDGIGTPRARRTHVQAIDQVLSQGDALVKRLLDRQRTACHGAGPSVGL
jgi:hypothetical protein